LTNFSYFRPIATTPATTTGASRNKRQAYAEEMDPALVQSIVAQNETAFNVSLVNVSDSNFPVDFRNAGKINITGSRLVLTGFTHFTEYVIYVSFPCCNKLLFV
jgi:hypothetical protein